MAREEFDMPTLDDVYRKFGETAEAAQLLETELGNVLLSLGAFEEDLLRGMNANRAADLLGEIDASTLGRLLNRLRAKTRLPNELEHFCQKHWNDGTAFRIRFIGDTISEEIRMRAGA
jgi:hypothetical protein